MLMFIALACSSSPLTLGVVAAVNPARCLNDDPDAELVEVVSSESSPSPGRCFLMVMLLPVEAGIRV